MTRLVIIVFLTTFLSACMPQLDNPLLAPEDTQGTSTVEGDGAAAATDGQAGSDASDASADGGDGSADASEEIPKVRPQWLVISEVLYDIPGSDSNGDSFIELAGQAGTEISDYQIAFINGSDGRVYDTIQLPPGSLIPDDTVFVVADAVTGSPGTSHVETADYVINFDPQNGPDAVQLLDDGGGLVDVVGYGSPIVSPADNGLVSYEGSPAEDVGSGMSIARVDTFDTDDNSLDFIQLETPSPGLTESPAK